jgi:hypothetical protein
MNDVFAKTQCQAGFFCTQNKCLLCDCREMPKNRSVSASYANRADRLLSFQPPASNPPLFNNLAIGTLLSDGYEASAQQNDVPVQGFSRGYLSVWIIYSALAFPLMWIVARYFSSTWYAPTGLDFGVALAVITGLFGRRYLSTEAMITSFIGALAFVHGVERGIFALSGLIVAVFSAVLLALVVGVIVYAVNSIQRPHRAEFDPRFNATDKGLPPTVPLAYKSLLRRLQKSQNTLRRGMFVVGPLFVLGMALSLIAQGAALLLGDALNSYELLTIAARAIAGGAAGGVLGWLQQQFIPDVPHKRASA